MTAMTPEDDDFTINDPDHVLGDVPEIEGVEVPEGDSGVLVAQPADPHLLRISRDGPCLVIGFNQIDIPDEVCIAGYREQVFRSLDEHQDCAKVIFDVSNVKLLPSGMLGLLATVKKRGREVEIVNPSPEVRIALRSTRLDTLMTIRDRTS
jgi:anti-anti-sigma factor